MPAHRDDAAMNGAQLFLARDDVAGVIGGPPALLPVNTPITALLLFLIARLLYCCFLAFTGQ